ncbi:alpha-amylase family glycosyl hydrolase [Arthrobacter sedimenti]|uniref:Alpha-amylase family glycosyl hydrolase n=1 Tax=Arthrobacter sedimenti TaxID=2694931 RepID=A0ABV8WR24_9MICC
MLFRTPPGAPPRAQLPAKPAGTQPAPGRRTRGRTAAVRSAAGLLAAAVAFSTAVLPAQAAPGPDGPGPNTPGSNGSNGSNSAGTKSNGSASAQHSLRGPVTDENFYFVMADRFSNGSTANDQGGLGPDPMVSGFDPTKKGFYNGGDLAGLRSKIDYIQGLGTTSIWLTPSFKNKAVQPEDKSAGYHGYWVTDFTQIDPHLGTNDELKGLIDEAHARGMKVYFDIITNHTADVIGYQEGDRKGYVSKDAVPYETASGEALDDRDYAGTGNFPKLDANTSFPYKPVLAPGEENLKVPAWLNDPTLYHNRGDTTFTGEDSMYGDFYGLDDLFTENPKVVHGMEDIYKSWIGDFGVDGFRIDTMKHVNDEFWQEFGPNVLSYAKEHGKDDFFMFGEVFDTSKSFTSQFTTRNRMQAVLDFPFQDAARNFASKSQDAKALQAFFAGDDWYTDADSNVYELPTFLGNHDMGRIGSFIAQDNPAATDAEKVARDELAHELMYFSRGNPVVYYGDEQGFTGPGGDQDARQTLFASKVPDYLDDDLLGTDATNATDNFNPDHPLYAKIKELAALTKEHPALRNGAHQHRYASDGPGIYAFSRTDAQDQREYVVALNNSAQPQTAQVPTYIAKRSYTRIYGQGADEVKTSEDAKLTVTVPPLSAVVYESSGRIPHSKTAPAVKLQQPAAAAGDNGRINVTADVDGTSFYEVTFEARTAGGEWQPIGTDDTAPYQVFHDVAALDAGTPLEYRATVLDNGGHTATTQSRSASVPAPVLTLRKPTEGSSVEGKVELGATADPEKSSHVVSFERSVNGGNWTALGTDSSSPVYTANDDVSGLADGTTVRYRAAMTGTGFSVTSETRTVTVGQAPQPDSVTVAGSLNQAMGCSSQWDPACAQAKMVLDPADRIWRLTVDLPAGKYEYKAALNGGWDENYGADGQFNGQNIVLDHPGGRVTFRYDNSTHVLSAVYASQQPGAVAAAGSMDSELGCASDWEPSCTQAQLVLDPADLVWKLTVPDLPAGSYEFKAALNKSWDVSYGAGGASPGANIAFKHDGGPVTFRYDHFTHVMTTG